jgi:hypothetical protein
MANRPFGQIECSLLKSKKMRALNDNDARYAYACVHLSELGNYSGFFRYPKIMWADDACLTLSRLDDVISNLTEVGLIEYDHEEQLVRVVAWFHKRNAPENASRMQSLIADYQTLETDNEEMFFRSASEFVVGSVRRAQRWKPDSTEWPKLRDAFNPFLRQLLQNYGDRFLDALKQEVDTTNKVTKREIHSLLPTLMSWDTPPIKHPAPTVGSHETKTRRDGNKNEDKNENENDTAGNLAKSSKPSPSRVLLSQNLHRNSETGPNSQANGPLAETLGSSLAREAIG